MTSTIPLAIGNKLNCFISARGMLAIVWHCVFFGDFYMLINHLLKKNCKRTLSGYPKSHTEPLFIKMNQPKLSDLYTCQFLKLYYKLYRNMLPRYFDNFLPEFGIHNHTLRNDLIRLPAIRCEFGEMNAKYQMHLRLRELASPLHSTTYPSIEISEDTLDTSIHCFSNYLKTQFVRSYSNIFNINDCFVCNIF